MGPHNSPNRYVRTRTHGGVTGKAREGLPTSIRSTTAPREQFFPPFCGPRGTPGGAFLSYDRALLLRLADGVAGGENPGPGGHLLREVFEGALPAPSGSAPPFLPSPLHRRSTVWRKCI